nr:EOG090X037N [Simocephalus serrulatus]
MASNPYFNNFIPAGSQQAAGTQAYGASAGPSPGYSAGGHTAPAAGQTSYDTAYPNTAAFADLDCITKQFSTAGYYGFAPKSNYQPSKNYFPGPPGPGKQDGPGLPPAHYQGYEAALFNAAHAYLHHQSGPKAPPMAGGGGPMPGNKPGPGGGGGQGGPKSRGRYFGGGFNQRWTSSSTQQLHYCEVCKISCASPQTYKDHLDGQKHKKKEAAVRTGLPMVPTPRTGAALHCELCNVTCTSSDAYAAHIRGTKHQKVVKLHTKLGKPIPPAEPQLIHSKTPGSAATTAVTTTTAAAATTTPAASTAATTNTTTSTATPTATTAPAVVKVVAGTPKINFLGGNYLNTLAGPKPNGSESEASVAAPAAAAATASQNIKKESEVPMTAAAATETALSVVAQWEEEKVIQPVGQDYVEELRGGDGKVTGFNCRLCDCRFNDVNAKDMHLKGRRHRLMYKKKVDPNLIVESKGWPALRQKNKKYKIQLKIYREAGWEGGEVYEEMPPAPSTMEESQPRPPAYWASPSRGLRHGGISMGLPPPPQYYIPPTGPMSMGIPNPAMRKPESNDDRHVMAKHAEIYPSDVELEAIQTLVSYVERSLKLVSDQLTHQPDDETKNPDTQPSIPAQSQSTVPASSPVVAPTTPTQSGVPAVAPATPTIPSSVPAAPTTTTAAPATVSGPVQPQRMLKGVMRVGLLAKGLLLKGDRTVQLVVLCSQPPTYQLLDRVAKALPAHLSAVAPSITFSVETLPNEAFVLVKSVQGHGLSGDILVKVSLTSPVVREEQLAAAAATVTAGSTAPTGNDVDMKDDAIKEGRLNTKDCLHSLALLRRAKWFQARANSLQNCVLTIRIMRDFCLRTPVWSSLDLWALELIVERAAFSAGSPLTPGDALRRVFETLSAGILFSTNDGWSPGIGDPCEKDAIDVLSNLTAQEREDMTASAQQALRQIAFRQIFKVLGLPKPLPLGSRSFKASAAGPSPGKKRPRENSTSEAVSPETGEVPTDLKKEKIEGQDA